MKTEQVNELQAKGRALDNLYGFRRNLHSLIEAHVKDGGIPWQHVMEVLHTEHLYAKCHVIGEWNAQKQGAKNGN